MEKVSSFDKENIPNIKIYFGHKADELYEVDSYFDNCFEGSWFESDLARRILKTIDRVYEVNDTAMKALHVCDDSPIVISPRDLSSGTKALLIMLNTDEPDVCLSRCGDNCIPFFLEIAKNKKVSVTLNNAFDNPYEFEFFCENDGKIYNTVYEFANCVMRYCVK